METSNRMGGDGGRQVRGSRRVEPQDAATGLSPVMARTGLFLLGGLGMLLAGAAVQPRFKSVSVEPEEQRVLFPELSDASKAASLEIVSYDDELSTLHPFKVVQSGGVWVLPAHQNYPADAREQLAAAATSLVDLKLLDVVSKSPGDHETFGVIEPDPEKIKPGMTGVGQLVEIRDASGNKLARLVVGKEDKRRSGDPSGRTLRFVRKSGQDPVYRVEIDTSKFTTRFGDWIEKDLLKLSPWDVRKVGLEDYALVAVESNGRMAVQLDRKYRLDLAYDDKASKWSLVKLESFSKEGKPKEEALAEGEELASTKLNDLRNALGDLKIVDVVRKPSGLSADLKAEESFANDREAVTSMQQRGFLPLKTGEILSTDGETIVGMKDGVEYVLRFGAATTVAAEKSGGKEDAAEAGKDSGAETGGRYLLVMARFNEGLLEKPVLDPLPEVPAVPGEPKEPADDKGAVKEKEEAKADGDKPAGGPKADAGEQGDAKPESKPETKDDAKEEAAAKGEGGAKGDGGTKGDSQAAGEAKEDAAKPAAEPAAAPAKPADGEAPPAPPAKDAAGDAPKKSDAAESLKKADEAEAAAQAALENRRRVERENRRKQDEYDDKVKAAQKRVRELNGRFADWYYVVSDKEYAKIHLTRETAVERKEAVGKDETAEGKESAPADGAAPKPAAGSE